jgi:translation initiation factor eIF-2B subunit delta
MSSVSHRHSRAPSQTNGTGQNDPSPAGAAQKPQKQMTKAERRELQERQRAAKAAQAGGPTAKQPHPTVPASSHPKKGGKGSEGSVQGKGSLTAGPSGPPNKSTKESKAAAAAAAAEEAAGRSRGLRIFSHFALQKPVGYVAKGDVHPAIVRLGLMFAEFKISGANARSIATLSVFKRVRLLLWTYRIVPLIGISGRSYKTTKLPRITHSRGTS